MKPMTDREEGGMQESIDTPAPLGPFDGLGAFLGGIGFIITSPRAWGYAAVPITVAVLLACGLTCLGWFGAFKSANALIGEASGFWAETGRWSVVAGLGLLALALALL